MSARESRDIIAAYLDHHRLTIGYAHADNIIADLAAAGFTITPAGRAALAQEGGGDGA